MIRFVPKHPARDLRLSDYKDKGGDFTDVAYKQP